MGQRIDVMISSTVLSKILKCNSLWISLLLMSVVLFAAPTLAQNTPQPITTENAAEIQQIALLGRGGIHDMIWSPDGQRLAVLGAVGVWIYDANAWESPPYLLGDTSYYTSSGAFDPTSNLLATNDRNGWRLWDVNQNRLIRTVRNERGRSSIIRFSPAGAIVATTSAFYNGRNVLIQLWDVSTGRELAYLDVRNEYYGVDDLTFSPDGKQLLVGAQDSTGFLYNVDQLLTQQGDPNRIRANLPTETNRILEVAFNINGQPFVLYNPYLPQMEANIMLHGVLEAEGQQIVSKADFYDISTLDLNLTSDLLAISGPTGQIEIYDTDNGALVNTLAGHQKTEALAFDPTGQRLVSVGDGYMLKIWDVTTGEGQLITDLHTRFGYSVAFSSDSHYLAFGTEVDGGEIQLWDMNSNQIAERIPGQGGWTSGMDFSSDSHFLATADGWRQVCPRIWNLQTHQTELTLNNHCNRGVNDVFFADGDRILVSTEDNGTIRLWDSLTGEIINTFTQEGCGLSLQLSAAVSGDGSRLVTVGRAWVWDVGSGAKIGELSEEYCISSVTNSPNGEFFATTNWNMIRVRRWDTLEIVQAIESDTVGFSDIVFSPYGNFLAAVTTDGYLYVFDISTGKTLSVLPIIQSSLDRVDWSMDGSRIAMISRIGTVHIVGTPR